MRDFSADWVCELLLDCGAQVICLDNYSTGLKSNIFHLVNHKRFVMLESSIEKASLDEHFDFILHFASIASPEEYQRHPVETIKVNALDTLKLLELARENGATFMFSSSSEVYGNPESFQYLKNTLEMSIPLVLNQDYQESKRLAETACMVYSDHYNVDIKIPRIFNTYGERLRPDGLYGRVIPRFIMQALTDKDITVHGNGKHTRSFCYVSDMCVGLIRVLETKEASGTVINLGNPDEITILELANIIIEMTGSASRISFTKRGEDDADRRCPNIEKARKILDWEPKVSLREGLRNTINWVKHFIDR